MFTQLLFWAVNQGNHQFQPILAYSQETLTDFHEDEAKRFYFYLLFFEKKNPKWPI